MTNGEVNLLEKSSYGLMEHVKEIELKKYQNLRDFYSGSGNKGVVIYSYFVFLLFLVITTFLLNFVFDDSHPHDKFVGFFNFMASLSIVIFSLIVVLCYVFTCLLVDLWRIYTTKKIEKDYKNKKMVLVGAYALSNIKYQEIADNFKNYQYSEHADKLNEEELTLSKKSYDKNKKILDFKMLFDRLFLLATVIFAVLVIVMVNQNSDFDVFIKSLSVYFVVFLIPLLAFFKLRK